MTHKILRTLKLGLIEALSQEIILNTLPGESPKVHKSYLRNYLIFQLILVFGCSLDLVVPV